MWKVVNWVLLLAVCCEMIWLGIKSSRVASSDDESGFLLAGRSLGPFVSACTIVATGYSGWCFVGSPGVTYHYGAIELLANFFFAPAIAFAVMFFAGAMRKRAAQVGSLTVPEYVARHHAVGKLGKLIQGVAAIITILLLMVFLTSQIKAVGMLTAQWLGIPINWAAFVIISMIIVYTTFGGLQAVAWTDTVMICGMMFATVVVCFQMFTDISPSELVSQLNAIDPKLLNPVDSTPYGGFKSASYLILPYAFMFAAVLPYMAVRFISMRPGIKLHSVGLMSAVFAIILSMIPAVGLYMKVKVPGLEVADNAMPQYLNTFLHPALAGIITICILFAMKSTADSLLHTVSSAVSYDIRNAFFSHREFTSHQKLKINRICVVTLGFTGFLMMLFAPPFFLNFMGILGTGTLQSVLIGPILVGTFWKGNGVGALASMVLGGVTTGSLLLGTDLGWVVAPITGDIVGIVTYFVVSMATFGVQPRLRADQITVA